MTHKNARKVADLGVMSLLVLSFLSAQVFAQEKIKGMIKARSGNTVILENQDQPYVNVILQDTTTVGQNQGLLKARKKEMSAAALIPGLEISVEGSRDENGMFVAKSITFNGNDLERAYSVQAGLAETEARSQANQARSKANQQATAQHAAELEKQNAALKAQNAALQSQAFGQGQTLFGNAANQTGLSNSTLTNYLNPMNSYASDVYNTNYNAAAKVKESGAAYSGAASVADGVWVYEITKNGLALQLTLQGTKYSKDKDLN